MPKLLSWTQPKPAFRWVILILALKVVHIGSLCMAQESAVKQPPDPQIANAIKQVSSDHIRQTIEKLVSFGNRSTISAQDEPSIKAGKGIGAARNWIKSEFERYSKECGG